MAHFNFTVDTNPMADSIEGVSRHVNGTTAAVVAMQTAVVIAKQNSANNICNNVNLGFYSLIRSQISQKIATHKSKADAKIMELQQQSISLASIKSRMEKDYNMHANRYTKLFNSLNKALKGRIFELDKPTTSFINKDILPTANRTKQLSAATSIIQLESVTSGQLISTSNTKYNALQNISSMKDFIYSSENQKVLIGSILTDKGIDKPAEIYIPIIINESEGLNVRQSQWSISQSTSGHVNNKIESFAYSNLPGLNWVEANNSETTKINQEFGAFVEHATVSDRIKKQMLKLLNASTRQKLA